MNKVVSVSDKCFEKRVMWLWGVGAQQCLFPESEIEGLFEKVILGLTLNGNCGKRAMGKSEGGILPLASLTRISDFG